MKRFRELEIHGPVEALRNFVASITNVLPKNWKRDPEAERRLAGLAGLNLEGFAFTRNADDNIPAATVFLIFDGDHLRVTNIVPEESGQLSIGQYNVILGEFEGVADAELERHDVFTLATTGEEVLITEWISPEAASLLERFSDFANKSTGSAHPSDFARWVDFIICTHAEGSKLYSEDLRLWLIEALDWPSEKADKLAREYEFARDVLAAYDRTPA